MNNLLAQKPRPAMVFLYPGTHGMEGSAAGSSLSWFMFETAGTYGYMSPEAANPKLGRKGPKSDVYAFGMDPLALSPARSKIPKKQQKHPRPKPGEGETQVDFADVRGDAVPITFPRLPPQ
eukprot:668288-Amphidinium_carterae.1